MLWSFFAASLLSSTLMLLVFAGLTLFFERKLIAIAQKRLGISFLGRNGWAHLPADLVKFWLKYTGRHQGNWLSAPAGVVGVILGYFTWSLLGCLFFLSDGGSVSADFWDYQVLAYVGYANLTSLFMYNIIAGLKSKYGSLASARILLVSILVEVFFTISFLLSFAHFGGYSFEDVATSSRGGALTLAIPPLALTFLLYALFEAKRAPFDHTEAESELVAGHMVEFGGRSLLFFYLCEYTHVFFCLYLILILCLGAGAAPAWHQLTTPGLDDAILPALC